MSINPQPQPWIIRPGQESAPLPLTVRGLDHHVLTWCVRPWELGGSEGDLLHLSAVGNYIKLKALWADLMDHRQTQVQLRGLGKTAMVAQRGDGARYITEWNDQPLPQSGLAHLAITHASAWTPQPLEPGFLHLAQPNGSPRLDLFLRQLDAALALPLRPAWAGQLWQHGAADAGLISPLPSYGCTAFWVDTSLTEWARISVAILTGCQPREIAALDVTRIGVPQETAEIVEQGAEGSDDDRALEGDA